jgi:signal transduction histidine kinase/CheY-like chemotaxis protein
MIFVSMQLSNFIDYYRLIVDPDRYVVNMARADGVVLARYPGENLTGRVLSPLSQFRQNIAHAPERGTYDTASELDGKVRLFAYRKVDNYPVYVSVGVSREAVIHDWLTLMGSHLVFGIPAYAALILLTLLALRHGAAADRAIVAAQIETDRRAQAEESLRQAQKMEAVGQLTGGVAHDFNNLLTVISGNLEMIVRRPDNAERTNRLAEGALRAVARAERLIRQLLMFSRRQALKPETFNINRLLLEFEGLIRRAMDGKDVELTMKLDPALDPAHLDRTQFEAACLNLAVNARDAVSERGHLIIETKNVSVDAIMAQEDPELLPGSYILVSVTDDGCGIEPSLLSRVFEPFFSTKEVGQGSGLGLSQVYGFAKESGGHVRIDSELGHGATIRLYLPRSIAATSNDSRSTKTSSHEPTGEAVLVVEDDESVLATTVENLFELGYRVSVARNGSEALAMIGSDAAIDVLFTDIMMPGGINGAQLATQVRQIRPEIKVLLTSGYPRGALSRQGLPDDLPILEKPYRPEQLAAQLRMIIASGNSLE